MYLENLTAPVRLRTLEGASTKYKTYLTLLSFFHFKNSKICISRQNILLCALKSHGSRTTTSSSSSISRSLSLSLSLFLGFRFESSAVTAHKQNDYYNSSSSYYFTNRIESFRVKPPC